MDFTRNNLIELVSVLDKLKIENQPNLTRKDKEFLKQIIEECKKRAQR